MAFKLAINAGHGMNTAGKRCLKSIDPNETREWFLSDRIADKIENLLSSYNVEVLRIDDTTGKKDIDLNTRTKKANDWKADFYLAIHANAGIKGGSGGGIMAFTYTYVDSVTQSWQKELYDELIRLTGLKGDRANPLSKANFHEVRETKMPAVLLELGFMDSTTDVPIILTDKFATQCAQACVNVIVRKAKLTKKVQEEVKPVVTPTTTKTTTKSSLAAGTKLNLSNTPLYATAAATTYKNTKTGTFYIWSTEIVNGKIRITNTAARVGVKGKVTGFIKYDEAVKAAGKSNTTAAKTIKKGSKLKLNKVPLYVNATKVLKSTTKTGTFYIWSTEVVNGRIRITNSPANVGRAGQVTGFIKLTDAKASLV
jgi:N-acetylmuramoyl-L-alanine amidase